jgi:Phage integrase family
VRRRPRPDDLLGEKRRAECANAENVADALHVPAFGQHLYADDAVNLLTRHAFFAYRADDFAQDGFAPLVGIEDACINLYGVPFPAVFVVWIARNSYSFVRCSNSQAAAEGRFDDKGTRLSAIRAICERAGIPKQKRHVHVLKHSRATHLVGTMDIALLRQLIGHKNIQNTMIYTHASDAQACRAAMEAEMSAFRRA